MHTNRYKAIKKIFHLARYDFDQHFSYFFCMAGVCAAIIMGFFSIFCWMQGNYVMPLWSLPVRLPVYLIAIANQSIVIDQLLSILFVAVVCVTIVMTVFFQSNFVQNCLDIAFDSAPRGISLSYFFGWLRTVGLMIYGSLFFIIQMCLFSVMAFWLRFNLFSILFFLFCVGMIQLLYLVIMEIMEYQEGMAKALQKVWQMVCRDYSLIVLVTFCQLVIAQASRLFLLLMFQGVVAFLMRIIAWVFKLFLLTIDPIFIHLMSTYFYAWAYLLVYSFVCLVTAHLYRYLACPPIENNGCLSCTDCD